MIGESLWVRLVYVVFWPITVLAWLARRPILRPMWFIIIFPFAYLVLALAGLIVSLSEEPIDRRISALWSRWIDRWPRPKRWLIRTFTILAIVYAFLALAPWFLGNRIVAIVYWGLAAAALVAMLIIHLRVRRKQANSS